MPLRRARVSALSRTATGVSSTPSDCATAWIAANWPMPAAEVGSRSTAARVTRGESCLSNSTHFPLMLYSKLVKPVALPPGRARLWINPAPTGSATVGHDDRDRAGRLQQRRDGHAADAHDHVRSKRNQVRGGSAQPVRIATGEASGSICRSRPITQPSCEALSGTPRRGLDVAAANGIITPMRRIPPGCCARTASGRTSEAAVAPPIRPRNSRRLL